MKHFDEWLVTCLLRSDSIRWSEKVYLDCNHVRLKWIEIRMALEAKNEQSVRRYDAKCFREIDMKSCRQCGSISFDCTSTKISGIWLKSLASVELIETQKKHKPDHNHFRMIRLTFSSTLIQWFIRKRFFLLRRNRLICLEHRLDWLNQCQTTDVSIWTIQWRT